MRFTDNRGPYTVGECVALGVMIILRDRVWNADDAIAHANGCLKIKMSDDGDDGYTRSYLDRAITDGGLWKGTL